MSDLKIKIDGDAEGLWGALEKSKKKVTAWGKGVGNILKSAVSLTGLAVGGGGMAIIGSYLKSATSAALGFSKGLSEINSIARYSRSELSALKKDLLEISTSKGFSTSDLTKATYQAISSNVPKDQMKPFLNTAGDAAVAGVTDLTTAVNGITTVINAFNLDVSQSTKVADVFFATVKGGKTTFPELSANIGQVASLAATAGYSFEEAAGALVVLTNANGSTAQSTTQLKATIQALVNPTEQLKAKLDAIAKAEGVSDVSALSLQRTLELVAQSCNYSKSEIAALFPSVEALQGVFSLTGDNADKASAALDKTANSAGACAEAEATMADDPSMKIAKLNAALAEQKILIGDKLLPVIVQYAEGLAAALTMSDKMRGAGATGKYADDKTNAASFALDCVTLGYGSEFATNMASKVKGKPIEQLRIEQTTEEQEKDRKYYVEKAKRVTGKDVSTTEDAKAALAAYAGSDADKATVNVATSTPQTRKAQEEKAAIDKRKAAADRQARIAVEVKQASEDAAVNKLVEGTNDKAFREGGKEVEIKGFTQAEKDDKIKASQLKYQATMATVKRDLEDSVVSTDADFEMGKITEAERNKQHNDAYAQYTRKEGEAKAIGIGEVKAIQDTKTITNSDKLKQVMEASGVSSKVVAKLSLEYDKASSDKEKAKALADVSAAMATASAKQKVKAKNKEDFEKDYDKRLAGIKQEAAYQNLLNQGKEREAAIAREIDSAKQAAKDKGQTLSETQIAQLSKATGEAFDARNPFQSASRNVDISNDSLSRVGGYTTTRGDGWASQKDKAAAATEKLRTVTEKIGEYVEKIASKNTTGGGKWPGGS